MVNLQKTIAITGVMGSGKSTLAEGLAAALGVPHYPELYKENPYIAQLYSGVPNVAFDCQRRSIELAGDNLRRSDACPGVLEVTPQMVWHVYSKLLNNQGLISDDQMAKLGGLAVLESMATRPIIYISLWTSPTELFKRIRARRRLMEAKVTLNYVTELATYYSGFTGCLRVAVQSTDSKVLTIFTDGMTADQVLDFAINSLLGMGYV